MIKKNQEVTKSPKVAITDIEVAPVRKIDALRNNPDKKNLYPAINQVVKIIKDSKMV